MLTDPPSTSDDDDLVREVVAGSHDALAALYDRHVDSVFSAARRLAGDRQVAEEVVQETFLTLWNRAERYDPRAGSLAAWLRTIARRKAVDRLRAAGRRPRLLSPSLAGRQDETDDTALDRLAAARSPDGGSWGSSAPERIAISRWTRRQIVRALNAMAEEERIVIVMAYDGDMSQAEISDELGWPIGTVKTRTRRALRRLRETLDADLGPDHEPGHTTLARSARTDGSR
jgi:RNA polymerase sigma-70 factor (ECF subfamily)